MPSEMRAKKAASAYQPVRDERSSRSSAPARRPPGGHRGPCAVRPVPSADRCAAGLALHRGALLRRVDARRWSPRRSRRAVAAADANATGRSPLRKRRRSSRSASAVG